MGWTKSASSSWLIFCGNVLSAAPGSQFPAVPFIPTPCLHLVTDWPQGNVGKCHISYLVICHPSLSWQKSVTPVGEVGFFDLGHSQVWDTTEKRNWNISMHKLMDMEYEPCTKPILYTQVKHWVSGQHLAVLREQWDLQGLLRSMSGRPMIWTANPPVIRRVSVHCYLHDIDDVVFALKVRRCCRCHSDTISTLPKRRDSLKIISQWFYILVTSVKLVVGVCPIQKCF